MWCLLISLARRSLIARRSEVLRRGLLHLVVVEGGGGLGGHDGGERFGSGGLAGVWVRWICSLVVRRERWYFL